MKIAITDKPAERTQVMIACELLESLNQASGGMEQLTFHRRDPRYLLMRDGLAVLKAFCIKTLPRSIRIGEREKKRILV
jgi:hypothetical protein